MDFHYNVLPFSKPSKGSFRSRKLLRRGHCQSIRSDTRSQHAGYRFSSGVYRVDARHALDDSRFFEESRVEFRGCSSDNGGIISREFPLRRCRGCRPVKMI